MEIFAVIVTSIPDLVSSNSIQTRDVKNNFLLESHRMNTSLTNQRRVLKDFNGTVQNFLGDSRKRKKRYAYEDLHEWPEGDNLDYDFEEDGESEELTFWQKAGRNWQVVGLRAIFLLAAGCMFFFISCCCCKICCRVCCQSLKENCVPCGGFLDLLTSFYEDPMYKRAKNLAEMMGLKLDYATYMKIKQSHDFEGTGAFNPLGLPYME